MEQTIQQALADKAVAQGKFEIAVDVLHDIGNAVVGLGSYLTRIRKAVEEDNSDKLMNLAGFFGDKQCSMSSVIGEAKAAAIVAMLKGIAESDQVNHEEMRKSISEQLHIITHIHEMLNIQRQYIAGYASGEKSPVNIRSVLNDCLSMLFASIDKRQIAVTMEVTSEPTIVQGDRTRLMQVMMNILKNSIEAIDMKSETKAIRIHLQVDQEFLILEVKDSGSGFDEGVADALFDRGFTTKSSGTGLGLHNCKTILEDYAGSISITSEGLGKGALTIIKFIL